ncbi:polysaccharide deacetylase family protein [Saccharococcus caldoxylosilyticus]|uniref:polysaccharide deacetylase family protein n=1 Tax=Saccharococcus caldoxylosilyticus TaxID=81408 RepID=UPI001FCC6E41|nr:polysaccharide deacetylase family protein [Parageobacillus caldoxylosilyticus]BDG45094.1 hypothetical protein PcaKH35_34390 [Parageobacillus caldoxylosilyticus]
MHSRALGIMMMLVLLFLLPYEKQASVNQKIFIRTTGPSIQTIGPSAPVYAYVADELQEVGKIYHGQAFEVVGENETYYFIQYGFVKGMVKKQDVKLDPPSEFTKLAYRLKRSVIGTKDLQVYMFQNGNKQSIGEIHAGVRYPVKEETKQFYVVELGGRDGYIYKHITEKDPGVPVLLYHHILEDKDERIFRATTTVPLSQFTNEMNYLKEQHYTTITPQQLLAYVKKEQLLPPKSVLITFDDGLKSNDVYAYPVLKRLNFKATIFMITGRMRPAPQPFDPSGLQFLSKQEVAKMQDVFTFESHTNHFHLFDKKNGPYLLFKPYHEIMDDLKASIAKVNATAIAYPFGAYDKRTIQIVKDAGFTMAFTTKKGTVYPGDPVFELKRQWVYPHITLQQFEQLLSP